MTLRSQRDEALQSAEQTHHLYLEEQKKSLEEQQRYRSTLTLYQEAKQQYESTQVLYQEAQDKAQSYLVLYDEAKARNSELFAQYETVQTERDQYLVLYNEAQGQLKFERRSKASIKGWETRRKRENELLKREIAEMTLLLRDSLERKEAAIDQLEELASRMDRIQTLVDSVGEETSTNPVGLLQKFKRIWQAIQDILAE